MIEKSRFGNPKFWGSRPCPGKYPTFSVCLESGAHPGCAEIHGVCHGHQWLDVSQQAETQSDENEMVLSLGSSHQLNQISITDIPLQSTTIRVAESACDFSVIIDLSCHCQHVADWRPFVGLVSITCVNFSQCSDHWHTKQSENSSKRQDYPRFYFIKTYILNTNPNCM